MFRLREEFQLAPESEPKEDAHAVPPPDDLLGMDDDGDDGRETDPLFGLPVEGDEGERAEQDSDGDTSQAKESDDAGSEGSEATAQEEGDADTSPDAEQSAKGPEADASSDQPTTAEPFTFFGREYESRDAAEHALRSHIGSVRSQQQRIDELTNMVARQTDEIVRLTRGESPDLSAAPANGAPAGRPTAGDTGKPGAEQPLTLNDAVQWDFYRKLRDDPDYGEEGAQNYLAQKMEQVLDNRLKKTLDERLGPIEERGQNVERFESLYSHMESLAERVDGDGGFLYPEMREDPGFVEAVARRLHQAPGLEDQGEYGIYLAVLAERDLRGYTGAPSSDAADESPSSPENGGVAASDTVKSQIAAKNEAAKNGVPTSGDGGPRPAHRSENVQSRIQQDLLSEAENFGDDFNLGIPDF